MGSAGCVITNMMINNPNKIVLIFISSSVPFMGDQV